MEILFSVVILSVGFMGILSIFPTAVLSGNKTVEDVYASMIAKSVIDALQVGMRESLGASGAVNGIYFVFDHDGVRDLVEDPNGNAYEDFPEIKLDTPVLSDDFDWDNDYIVIVPNFVGTPGNYDTMQTPVYVYPRGVAEDPEFGPLAVAPSDAPGSTNGGGDPANCTDESDFGIYGKVLKDEDGQPMILGDGSEAQQRWIRNVYQLKVRRVDDDADEIEIPEGDAYSQYSYAFSVRLGRIDSQPPNSLQNGIVDENDEYDWWLMEIIVYVFRGYSAHPDSPRNNPIQAFSALVAR